ncbi:unnamed protein product [Prorocentrum cordatum]|uniref:Uncharacterized protein n=1 Tax=Prorocentrum cordatum TaxID=2364126 RepID=A0ABN9UPK3_9DINO|nr:unnamed protein product [Polarella glacialis]
MASAQNRQGFSLESPQDKKDRRARAGRGAGPAGQEGRWRARPSGTWRPAYPRCSCPASTAPRGWARGAARRARARLGEVRILLWQPQSGKKKGVRWWDFGGRKEL